MEVVEGFESKLSGEVRPYQHDPCCIDKELRSPEADTIDLSPHKDEF